MAEGSTPEPQDPVTTVLADLWAKRRPEVESDLGTLQALIEEVIRTPNDQGCRNQAIAIAHRLHGALGVFGFTAQKNRLADIETELRSESTVTTSVVTAVEMVLGELPR